jgi:flagellar motility protein MotE (MotC chaperone)
MIRLTREFRLIPVVIFAAVTLFALKMSGLLLEGGYTVARPRPANAQEGASVSGQPPRSWAQDVFGYPDVTGSINAPKPPDKAASPPPAGDGAKPVKTGPPKPAPEGAAAHGDGRPLSPAERAILERLQERRQELEQRARDMDLRENLIKAAEKRLEARVAELAEIEGRINAAMNKKDETEAARFKGIVTMYESMKAKDAAKIFDRLELKILLDVASQINPRRMSDILAQMSPEAAERLTVELARRVNAPDRPAAIADLPKIEGRSPVP